MSIISCRRRSVEEDEGIGQFLDDREFVDRREAVRLNGVRLRVFEGGNGQQGAGQKNSGDHVPSLADLRNDARERNRAIALARARSGRVEGGGMSPGRLRVFTLHWQDCHDMMRRIIR